MREGKHQWSQTLEVRTREALTELALVPLGDLRLKHVDGRFGVIAVGDLLVNG